MTINNPDVIRQQRAYYEERSSEYDDWWERRGRYDAGPRDNQVWHDEVDELRRFVEQVEIHGQVLELASGTGRWTAYLATRAAHVTSLDGSSAMLARNQQRLARAGGLDRVSYERVDLFAWSPQSTYDVVFVAFWLSHVPAERLEPFLANVAAALTPAGCLVVLDSRPRPDNPWVGTVRLSDELELRTLQSGAQYRVVKRFFEDDSLNRACARQGIALVVHATATHFIYGAGTKLAPGG